MLLFSSFAERGRGGQESLRQLALTLDRSRFHPVVLVPTEGSLAQSLRRHGVEVRVLSLPPITVLGLHASIRGLRRLLSLTRELRIEILHTDGPRNTLYAGLVGWLQHKPLVWHVRASAADRADRFITRLCTRLILVAEALRPRFSFCDRSKLAIIYNGVDLNRFMPRTRRSVTDEVVIGTVGRVEPQKGILTLLRAVRLLRSDAHPHRVRIAGHAADPEYVRACREFITTAGIGERVSFEGHVQAVARFMGAIDIFVLSSAGAEAFPRSVIEAMACGKPVVVTDAGGTPEAVEDGRSGFVVPAQSPEALADKLRVLIGDEDLRDRMGRHGRRRAEAFFDIAANTDRTSQVYEEMLACR